MQQVTHQEIIAAPYIYLIFQVFEPMYVDARQFNRFGLFLVFAEDIGRGDGESRKQLRIKLITQCKPLILNFQFTLLSSDVKIVNNKSFRDPLLKFDIKPQFMADVLRPSDGKQ